jgi:hypothetical protein
MAVSFDCRHPAHGRSYPLVSLTARPVNLPEIFARTYSRTNQDFFLIKQRLHFCLKEVKSSDLIIGVKIRLHY